ncbi:hypothetical protein Tco_0455110 [Tanacetum coccineum]
MESCDPVGTPMEIKDKLDLDQNGTLVDATKYPSMIGALTYLTSSRPHIVHVTCLCARYPTKPTKKHLKEIKRIFCYLRGTVNMGLWYTKDYGFELTGFSDADYAGSEYRVLCLLCPIHLDAGIVKDYGFTSTSFLSMVDSKSAIAYSTTQSITQEPKTHRCRGRYLSIKGARGKSWVGLLESLHPLLSFMVGVLPFEEVAKMKDPFDLSKVKGYRSSYKKEHTKAENDLATDTFPFISEFIVDPFAPIEVLPSKKPASSTSSYNKESCSYTFEGFNL